MESLLSMFQAFESHMKSGHMITLTHWHCIHGEDFSMRKEGVLVSPRITEMMSCFPCGSFECGYCKQLTPMVQTSVLYYEGAVHALVCEACVQPPDFTNSVVLPILYPSNVPVSPSPLCVYEDRRPHMPEQRVAKDAYYKQVCETYATTFRCIYLDGKTVRDLYLECIRKRYFRRWRSIIQKRSISRMFQVLLRNAMIGKDAAMVLAKTTVLQKR